MKTTGHGIEESRDVENVHRLRLMTLLQELVRERGYKGTARVLEIDPQTMAEAAKTGRLSRRVREALHGLARPVSQGRSAGPFCAILCPEAQETQKTRKLHA